MLEEVNRVKEIIDSKHKSMVKLFCLLNDIWKEERIANLYALLAVIFMEGEKSGAKRMREIDERD